MTYTEADQRADRAFLVGANYGRADERVRMANALLAKNVRKHGEKCLCLVCAAFTEAAGMIRRADQ